ncbi:MAG: FadR/GntR family transcriptional regulator, partial [Brevundimonas sp.]
QVLDALFARRLKPGAFLGTEAQLTETFQASRVPVREALGRLEALGVVQIKTGSGGGASIAVGEPGQFSTALAVQFMLLGVTAEEVFDARIAVEARAAELAAIHAESEDIERLKRLLAGIRSSSETGRPVIEAILDYHMAIVETSRARTLVALMQALSHVLLNLYLDTSHPAGSLGAETGYQSLGEELRRIETRDAAGASRAMHEHLLRQRDAVIRRLEAGPPQPQV